MINWFNHCYPYSNFHELNLDWVIYTVKKGEADIKNFIGLNTIKYADPILWDITRQYEANTVVVDPTTGSAFISIKPVPYGTHINNTDYWTQIYNYSDIVDTLREQIAYNEGLSTTATRAYSIDDLVFTNTELYRVVAPMIAGDSFVADSNVVKTTINDELLRLIDKISDVISDLADEATARENADGVLQDNIDAEATARENADGVLQDNIDAEATARENADGVLQDNIDAEATARENADGVLQDNIDAEATARENADNEISDTIGSLSDLTTDDKTSVVNAINSVKAIAGNLLPLDVTKHGVIGDGLTNNVNAFNQILSAYPNYAYYFPKGDYIFTGSGFKGNINVFGDGDAILYDFVYENLDFPQTNRGTPYNTNQDFFSAQNLKFQNKTNNSFGLTIHVQSQGSVLRTFDIRNCVFDSEYGLNLINCITGNISSCDFIHNTYGIKFESSTNITVAECNWYSPIIGIDVGVSSDDTAGRSGGESIMLTACQMIDGVTAISLYRHNYLELVNCLIDYFNIGIFNNASRFTRIVNTYIGYDEGDKSGTPHYIAPPNYGCIYGWSNVQGIPFSFEAINAEFTAYANAQHIPVVADGTGTTMGEDIDLVACRFTGVGNANISQLLYLTLCSDVYLSGNRFYAPSNTHLINPYIYTNCIRVINSNNDYANCFNGSSQTILPSQSNRQNNNTYQETINVSIPTDGTSVIAGRTIDFNATYDTAPVVVATMQAGGVDYYKCILSILNLTASGCTINLYKPDGVNLSGTYNISLIVMHQMY